MKIAVFIKRTTFHKGYGGLETQNDVLCEGLTKIGHSVVVFSPRRELSTSESLKGLVEYKFVDAVYRMGVPLISKGTWNEKSVEEFLAIHKTYKFDLILSQSSAGLGLIKQKDLHGLPIISIAHGSIFGEFLTRIKSSDFSTLLLSPRALLHLFKDALYVLLNSMIRQRVFVWGSNKVVAVSTSVMRNLQKETKAPDSKFVVIHNGIDPNLVLENTLPNKKKDIPQLLFVSRIERSKGIFLLIQALSKLQNLSWNLTVVGSGPDFELALEQVKRLNLQSRICFLGNVPQKEVLDHMVSSDLFVLPSLRVEGFPMVLVEAMFSGLPIIASDIGGNSDAIVSEETGLLIKSGDLEQLQNTISRLILNTSELDKFSTNAKIRAEKKFTLDVMLSKYQSLLEEVVNENS